MSRPSLRCHSGACAILAGSIALLLASPKANAQIDYSTAGSQYSQNFDSLPGSATSLPSTGVFSFTTNIGATSMPGWFGDASVANKYSPKNLTFCIAAKYPTTKSSAPLYAISMNSKLYDSTLIATANVVLSNFQSPANTVAFQEAGVAGDTILPGQTKSNYDGQSMSFASRTVARYNGYTLAVMMDGHAVSLLASTVVAPTGKAYYPQNLGSVYWTLDPTANAND